MAGLLLERCLIDEVVDVFRRNDGGRFLCRRSEGEFVVGYFD